MCVLIVQIVFALTAGAVLILDPAGLMDRPGVKVLAGLLILMPIALAVALSLRFHRSHRAERTRTRVSDRLMDTVLSTSREWLWAVDDQGIFTFSSPTSTIILGWPPAELVGEHCGKVIDADALASARRDVSPSPAPGDGAWKGVVVRCRHRDGSPVWMEVSGNVRPVGDRQHGGFEGTGRVVPRKQHRKQPPHTAERASRK